MLTGVLTLECICCVCCVRRTELSRFFSELSLIQEHRVVLDKAGEDAGVLDLQRLGAAQVKGLELAEAVRAQTVRVNELLEHYEVAVRGMHVSFPIAQYAHLVPSTFMSCLAL